jgi:preprotein translocase subunit SecY
MLQAFINVWKIPELRNKILFTIAMLAVFRIGHWIPLPGVNQDKIAETFAKSQQEGGTLAAVGQFVAMMSGGSFSHSTIFGLGVMPYITAGIIFQLLMSVLPALKKLQEEGPTGRQQIQQWTRYATIALATFQGWTYLGISNSQGILYAEYTTNPMWWVMAIAALTAGCVFLMWIGEQIDRFGIGNGISMIIMAGILSQMPGAIQTVYRNFDPSDPAKLGVPAVLSLVAGFVVVVAGAVLLTVAQRRIPIQQAKHTRGRKVYGGQRSYLPLRLNHAGVMPVVFASSLMIFPVTIFGMLDSVTQETFAGPVVSWLHNQFSYGEFPYILCEVLMIYFFSYFWITVQFNPEEMSKQLRDTGAFIPGLRPGPRTRDYLQAVMDRITYVGAAFLAAIAVLPMIVSRAMGVDMMVTQFLGGTGLLIVVSVLLDFIQRVEANLLMRNYAGFLSSDEGRGPRIQSARSMY